MLAGLVSPAAASAMAGPALSGEAPTRVGALLAAAPPPIDPPDLPGGVTGQQGEPSTPQAPALITVVNTNDSGLGSLRQAIIDAASGETINFDSSLSGQVIALTSGQLDINKSLIIDGSLLASRVSISGRNTLRVFNVYNNSTVTLRGLAVINGSASDGAGAYVAGGSTLNLAGCLFSGNVASNFGGGVYNWGILNVTGGIFINNRASWGGGVENRQTLTVADATFISNTATSGGAGAETYGGTVTMIRSAFINNIADNGVNIGSGGGFQSDPGTGNVTLTNNTFSGNQARGAADDGGGAIMSYGGTLYLSHLTLVNNYSGSHGGGISTNAGYPTTIYFNNTIIFGNTAAASMPDDLYGTFQSQDYDLIGTLTGATLVGAVIHNLVGQNPRLNTLADNGGSSFSFALLPGSPAIDYIPKAVNGCGSTLVEDQRGEPRPLNYPDYPGGCVIGAFELQDNETFNATISESASQSFGATLTSIQDNVGGTTPGSTTVTRVPITSTWLIGGEMPFSVDITAVVSSGLDISLSLCYTAWEAALNPLVNVSRLELYRDNGGTMQRVGADARSTDPTTGVTCVTKYHVSDLSEWTLMDPAFPTAVTLANFSARTAIGQVQLTWQTLMEVNTLGFNLYRSDLPDSGSEWQKLNASIIPARAFGKVGGALYAFTDLQAQAGKTYYYWLEVVNLTDQQLYGPEAAQALVGLYLPLVCR
jgi:hypothetical protein